MQKKKSFEYKSVGDLSNKINRNIAVSLLIKGGGILFGLMLIPITINYVKPLEYGIWLTLSSVAGWINFFDLGMGNGLRNKLVICFTKGDFSEARKLVSSSYAALFLIVFSFGAIYLPISRILNFNELFGISHGFSYSTKVLMDIIVFSVCTQLVLQLINPVLLAHHESAIASFIPFVSQTLLLVIILVIKHLFVYNLYVLVAILSCTPVFILLFFNFYLFGWRYRNISPKFQHVDYESIKNLIGLGGKFFALQIGALALFQTDNIIISKILGPLQVTDFNIIYKLYSVLLMVFTIYLNPYWSAFTNYYNHGDFDWIAKKMNSIKKSWIGLCFLSVIICIFSPLIIDIWIGHRIKISWSLSISMMIYVVVLSWQNIHVYFLNGIGKIKLQLYVVTGGSLINIPLSILLGKVFGLPGVICANTSIFIVMIFFFNIQTKKILKQSATGIWNS